MLPQQHTKFETDPRHGRVSFHEIFARLVNFRKDTINSVVSKTITSHAIQTKAQLPDTSRYLNPSFTLETLIPAEKLTGKLAPYDEKNMMGSVVQVKEVPDVSHAMSGDHYKPDENGFYAPDLTNPNAVLRDNAYQRLAAIPDTRVEIANN